HPYQAALHPSPVAPVSGSKVVAGIAFDDQLSAFHPDTCKSIDIALCSELAALPPGTDMHGSVLFNDPFAGRHLHADVFYPADIALDDDPGIGCGCPRIARDIERFAEGILLPAFIGMEGCDLGSLLSCKCIGGDVVCFKEEFRLCLYGYGNSLHFCLTLTVSRRPRSLADFPRGNAWSHRSFRGSRYNSGGTCP